MPTLSDFWNDAIGYSDTIESISICGQSYDLAANGHTYTDSEIEEIKRKARKEGEGAALSKVKRVGIKRVIFNDPATIVMWDDGTKTIVKANNEPFDKEKGLAMAICKKVYGNKGNFNNIFREYCAD